MSTFGTNHEALLAEYRSLMDEERTLWDVVGPQLMSGASAAAVGEADVDLQRWAEVRRRESQLDKVFDALSRRGAADPA